MNIRTIKTSVFSGFGFCVHSFLYAILYDTIGRTAKRKSENTMKWHRVIVEAINQKSNAQEIWNEVYKDLVEPCVNMIHNDKNESAYTLYKLYSLKLNQKYKA